MQITKVILQYSDGDIAYIEGEDAQKWDVFCQQVSSCAMIHGVCPPFDSLKWKRDKLNVDEQKENEENKESESSGKEIKETKRT